MKIGAIVLFVVILASQAISYSVTAESSIDKSVKIEVCKGLAISRAIEELGQKDPWVKSIRVIEGEEGLGAHQAMYIVVLTEIDEGDYYAYGITMNLSANPENCEVEVLESLPTSGT